MRYIYAAFAALLWSVAALAHRPATRIILIGNSYEANTPHAQVLEAIRNTLPLDSGTIVLFLGNNARNAADTASLRSEASLIAGSGARAFFIPGFLDWAKGGGAGYKSVLAQQRFIKSLDNPAIKYYPGDGCPGPKKVELGNDAVIYIMDSQWWLQEGIKPDVESDCKYRSQEEILAEIEDIPKDEFDKLILFVTHHPFENTGLHSGSFGLKQHVFPLTDIRGMAGLYLPLPVLGSLYPIGSNAVSSLQDLQNPKYQTFVNTGFRTNAGVDRAFSKHPNTIFIAGQEHNLQVLKREGHFYLNSGATGTPTRVRPNKYAEYVKAQPGFMVLDILPEKEVKLTAYIVDGAVAKPDYSKTLLNYGQLPPLAKDTARLPFINGDSMTAAISPAMDRESWLKRVLIGNNYRRAWSTPVRMKVLHLDQDFDDPKITGIGGGHESRSLQFKDGADRKWAFRASNKDLSAVIPEGFQKTVASEYVQDMLSASHPYGALVVAGLQEPLGIVQAKPAPYFMPNDTAMGPFRPVFANQVGMVEERKLIHSEPGQRSTTEAFNNMIDEGDHRSDQPTYLKIRLMDFLIADFDRHHGQYSWGLRDSGERRQYYPIPKDRDQAFYNNNGLIMSVAKHGAYSFMVNFPRRIEKMENMGVVGAYLDNVFMNRLTAADWRKGIDEFVTTTSDAVIDSAVHRFPPEIYALDGKKIAEKLKSRRQSIAEDGMQYYRFISKRVNVFGGNGSDRFTVSGSDSGLSVMVFSPDTAGNVQLRYARTFDRTSTKEIRLFGFNGDDRFEIDPSARGRIRLRMIGGTGNDTFNMRGGVRNYLYDLKSEDNEVLARSRTTKLFSSRPDVNEFRLRETLHNSFSLPLITLGYNVEDGVIGGIGLAYRTYGFRKYPYASLQRFVGSFASGTRAYMVRYKGEFIDVFRRYDLLINGDHYNPVLKNFFGFGNETVRDTSLPVRYYRTRYDYVSLDVMARRRFHRNRTMSIAAGPSAYYYWYDEKPNRGRVLQNPEQVGLDSGSVFNQKLYAGGKAAFIINTLNNELLPTRGINWTTEFAALRSMNESAKSLTKLTSTLDVYAVLNEPNRLLAALHFGGGHIFSDHFEYFQALTLGGNNYLRGYRVNRFSGASMAYASAELKLKLLAMNTYFLKGDFGIVGFNDVGRVWMPGERSDKWHHGYGGGVYLTPYNALMFSAVMGVSEEDMLFNFSIGTKLNVVFQGI